MSSVRCSVGPSFYVLDDKLVMGVYCSSITLYCHSSLSLIAEIIDQIYKQKFVHPSPIQVIIYCNTFTFLYFSVSKLACIAKRL